ncbi:MAG: carbohydrate ABC transporter permease [Ancrocorticia sp.]|uniref:carbohydrate ABC transporter permease n=1 Tax=Ancrocorticia sp. TaxID=2593684 RepID=UPI003F91E2BD
MSTNEVQAVLDSPDSQNEEDSGRTAAVVRPARPKKPVAQRILGVLGNGVVNVLLIAVAVFWLVPTIGLFLTSLRAPGDNASSGWWTVFTQPAQLTIENYQNLLSNPTITGSFWNTVVIAVPTTILVALFGALAAYAFAWMKFPGRDWLLIAVIILLAVPLQVAFIPLARMFGTLGISGSVVGVILFHVSFGLPFAIFLLRNFFVQIPGELLESARIDGAGEWRIFFTIVLPLGLPAIASLSIFQFLWTWNDMLVALIFTNSGSQPLTVAIQTQLRQFGSNIDVLSSGAFLSMLVPLFVFFAFQRYFVQALLAGSQK